MSSSTTTNKHIITIHTGNKYPSRSHSTDGNKLKTPRVIPSRTLFINSNTTSKAPAVPNTPPVCHKQANNNNRPEYLANLRDILHASHQTRNKPTHIQSASISRRLAQKKSNSQQTNTLNDLRRASQASLKDILKLADADDEISRRLRADANEKKVSKIERDLQDSLRMLKHYNETADKPVEEAFNFTRKSFLSSQELLKSNQLNNDSMRLKSIQLNKKLNNLIDQVDSDINEKKFQRKLAETSVKLAPLSSSSESILNECSILIGPNNCSDAPKMSFNKDITAANLTSCNNLLSVKDGNEVSDSNKEKDSQQNQVNEPIIDLTTNYWKYNELEELRIKFTSLLTPNIKEEQKIADIQTDITGGCGVASKLENKLREEKPSVSHTASMISRTLKAISPSEKQKIESFYSSYGTSLFTASACACLYTMTSLKPASVRHHNHTTNLDLTHRMVKSSNSNRASMAIAPTSARNPSLKSTEIDQEILNDFMTNKYQNHVSVYHRGVPLWLVNSGKNPRRPLKQIKFTLAEKGTGFILWQDRIDTCSDFRVYAQRKSDQSIINYATFCDKQEIVSLVGSVDRFEQAQETFSAMLITFRASDKKTTVFVKFDLNSESARFYDFYAQITKQAVNEVRQRTKSLPAGVDMNISNRAFNAKFQSNYDNLNNLAVTKRVKKPHHLQSNVELNKLKRQSYFGQMLSKQKRISKYDISQPSDLKHIIGLNSKDRSSYYTLSKLLPETVADIATLSISSSSANENSSESSIKSTPSPTCSSSSTSSLSFSSNNKKIESITRDVWETSKRGSNKTGSTRSSSSSSSLSISPPYKLKVLESVKDDELMVRVREDRADKINTQFKRFEINHRALQVKKMAS